ncbi:hypothetical protein [Candidatus Entotheonella palauensis]|uniref:hypothetical protein n=1 Tax=Candidatus Entotheonella palauensis TaxID=93172 RepID=UPI002118D171|nr:hypothetical protein [Candidatus Entotheonella palauensis]
MESEQGYDWFQFDYKLSKDSEFTTGLRRSGFHDWHTYRKRLKRGIYNLRWTYMKDGSTSNGADVAWVDNISWETEETQTVEETQTIKIRETVNPAPMRRIAMDGLATGEIDPPAWADLFPGYREDVLVHFKKAGIYFLVDRGIRQGQQASPVQPLFKGGDTTKILAVIKVVDSSENLPKAYLGTRSWTAPAKRSFPADNAFRKYQPHKSLLTAGQQSFEVHKKCKDMKTYDGCQNVRLGINFQPPSTLNFTVGGNGDRSQDIYQPYQNVGKPGGPTDAPFNPKQKADLASRSHGSVDDNGRRWWRGDVGEWASVPYPHQSVRAGVTDPLYARRNARSAE